MPGTAGKTIRLITAVKKSLRPKLRPGQEPAAPEPVLVAGLRDGIQSALAEAQATPDTAATPPAEPEPKNVQAAATKLAKLPSVTPKARPANLVMAAATPKTTPTATPAAASAIRQTADPTPEIVTRVSTSGGRHWGINVGRYGSRYEAERVLLKTALNEMATLDGTLRRVIKRKGGFDANFMGLNRDTAELACRRLQARNVTCFMIGPG